MIQEGRPSKKKEEAGTLRAYMATGLQVKEPYYLCDSEVSITFSQRDHSLAIPRPGHAPLVLEAQIGGYDMSRVFMDGGSSINVIFSNTLRKMLIPRSALKSSDITLYGVEPGKATSSLGRINLDVIFGNRNNF